MVDGEAPVSIGSWEIHSWRVAAAALAALAPLLLVRLQIANVANVKMILTQPNHWADYVNACMFSFNSHKLSKATKKIPKIGTQ